MGAGADPLDAAEDAYQAKVMNAIYGETGVKAGHTEGQCKEDLLPINQNQSRIPRCVGDSLCLSIR